MTKNKPKAKAKKLKKLSATKRGQLALLKDKIQREVPFIGVKPYSHNIVGLLLSEIAEKVGDEYAYAAIKEFGLDKKGWGDETEDTEA